MFATKPLLVTIACLRGRKVNLIVTWVPRNQVFCPEWVVTQVTLQPGLSSPAELRPYSPSLCSQPCPAAPESASRKSAGGVDAPRGEGLLQGDSAGQHHEESLGHLGTPFLTMAAPCHSLRGCASGSPAGPCLVIGLHHDCSGLHGPLRAPCSLCLKANMFSTWLVWGSQCSACPVASSCPNTPVEQVPRPLQS